MSKGEPSLKAVAAVFFVIAIFSAVDTVFDLSQGRVSLNPGILGFFVSLGLLRQRRPWLAVAVILSGIALVGSTVLGVLFLVVDEPVVYSGFGLTGSLPAVAGALFAAVGVAFSCWLLRVLTRPGVRQMFQPPCNAA